MVNIAGQGLYSEGIGQMVIKILLAALLFIPSLCFAGPQQIKNVIGMAKSSSGLSVSDNFNRANADLTTPWVHLFTPDGIYANLRVSTNVAAVDASRIGYAYYDDSFSNNHKVCLKIAVLSASAGSYSGPVVRTDTTASTITNYTLRHENGSFKFIKYVSGTPTTLATLTGTPALNDIMCLSVSGGATTTLSATINGGTAQTYEDSTSPITAGKPAIMIRRGTQVCSVDDFTAEDI